MVKILGVNRVRQKLKGLQNKARRDANVSVIVGYTAEYALHVHEDRQARHAPGKRAGFLVDVLRENQDEIAGVARSTAKITSSLLSGLLTAGERLQRESQKVVPIDTGNLRGSAFTRKE